MGKLWSQFNDIISKQTSIGPFSLKQHIKDNEDKYLFTLVMSLYNIFDPVDNTEVISLYKYYLGELKKRNTLVIFITNTFYDSMMNFVTELKDQFDIELDLENVIFIANIQEETISSKEMFYDINNIYYPSRCTFVIDNTNNKIKYSEFYPKDIGRSIKNIIRVIDRIAMVTTNSNVSLPISWDGDILGKGSNLVFDKTKFLFDAKGLQNYITKIESLVLSYGVNISITDLTESKMVYDCYSSSLASEGSYQEITNIEQLSYDPSNIEMEFPDKPIIEDEIENEQNETDNDDQNELPLQPDNNDNSDSGLGIGDGPVYISGNILCDEFINDLVIEKPFYPNIQNDLNLDEIDNNKWWAIRDVGKYNKLKNDLSNVFNSSISMNKGITSIYVRANYVMTLYNNLDFDSSGPIVKLVGPGIFIDVKYMNETEVCYSGKVKYIDFENYTGSYIISKIKEGDEEYVDQVEDVVDMYEGKDTITDDSTEEKIEFEVIGEDNREVITNMSKIKYSINDAVDRKFIQIYQIDKNKYRLIPNCEYTFRLKFKDAVNSEIQSYSQGALKVDIIYGDHLDPGVNTGYANDYPSNFSNSLFDDIRNRVINLVKNIQYSLYNNNSEIKDKHGWSHVEGKFIFVSKVGTVEGVIPFLITPNNTNYFNDSPILDFAFNSNRKTMSGQDWLKLFAYPQTLNGQLELIKYNGLTFYDRMNQYFDNIGMNGELPAEFNLSDINLNKATNPLIALGVAHDRDNSMIKFYDNQPTHVDSYNNVHLCFFISNFFNGFYYFPIHYYSYLFHKIFKNDDKNWIDTFNPTIREIANKIISEYPADDVISKYNLNIRSRYNAYYFISTDSWDMNKVPEVRRKSLHMYPNLPLPSIGGGGGPLIVNNRTMNDVMEYVYPGLFNNSSPIYNIKFGRLTNMMNKIKSTIYPQSGDYLSTMNNRRHGVTQIKKSYLSTSIHANMVKEHGTKIQDFDLVQKSFEYEIKVKTNSNGDFEKSIIVDYIDDSSKIENRELISIEGKHCRNNNYEFIKALTSNDNIYGNFNIETNKDFKIGSSKNIHSKWSKFFRLTDDIKNINKEYKDLDRTDLLNNQLDNSSDFLNY